jgi:HEPN domain-containing protein
MDDKVKYWIDLSESDLSAAKVLVINNMLRQAAFFCHQALEKSLKAVIARDLPDGDMPPKTHDLIRLASEASLMNKLSSKQESLLELIEPLSIDARYPGYEEENQTTPTKEICERVVAEVEEFLCWIKKQL